MKALLQRVLNASVVVNGQTLGAIEHGLVVFIGVEKGDTTQQSQDLANKVLNYRIFADDNDKMNLNVQQAKGSVLAVSQFTLAANTKKGLRPSFSSAGEPSVARGLYDDFVEHISKSGITVATGEFGADMKVSLVNNGPVTFLLES